MGDEVLSAGVGSAQVRSAQVRSDGLGSGGLGSDGVRSDARFAGGEEDGSEEVRLRAAPSPWADLAGGARTGTLVHAILERTDFAASDLDSELATQVGEQVVRRMPELSGGHAVTDLAVALRDAIETPLGPALGDIRLRDVEAGDRLDELAFELPLAGGDSPAHDVGVGALARLLRRRVPGGDPLAGYADRLSVPALDQSLRGYLTGSIDLVVRRRGVPDPGWAGGTSPSGAGVTSPGWAGGPSPGGPDVSSAGTDRFTVVDYKTNWLGGDTEELSAWHYRPAALAETMQASHYPLQALLYSVALHRYLRWRLPGYDPDRNLAGVAYLFVRGMTGAAVPRVDDQPCGVFSWRPPLGLVAELSDLLDRGDGLLEQGDSR
jgi:exodeoxyribonuclease V beta subunit